MGLKETVKRLEARIGADGTCPHRAPIIMWPDGSVENDDGHKCDSPRIILNVVYEDGSDQRTRNAARNAFAELRQQFPDFTAEQIAEVVAGRFIGTSSNELLSSVQNTIDKIYGDG